LRVPIKVMSDCFKAAQHRFKTAHLMAIAMAL
jgi:hypothetical protein